MVSEFFFHPAMPLRIDEHRFDLRPLGNRDGPLSLIDFRHQGTELGACFG